VSSIFYRRRLGGRPKVTYLLLEAIAALQDLEDDLTVYELVAAGMLAAGLVTEGELEKAEDKVEQTAKRLAEMKQRTAERTDEEAEPEGQPASDNAFGASYKKWAAKQGSQELCLLVADYDLQKAEALYCDTDIEDVDAIVTAKLQSQWERDYLRYEGPMFAFGGKYQKTEGAPGGGDGETVDATTEEGLAALAEHFGGLVSVPG